MPITSLAGDFKDPARFIGIHFFSPVEKMMLVEIILGKHTGDAALATAMDYVRAIKKTPIVVNDSRGFYTSRVVGTYIREGHLMLSEGVPPAMIENVAAWPACRLARSRSMTRSRSTLPGRSCRQPRPISARTRLILGRKPCSSRWSRSTERYGRKNRKGFYDYPEQGPKRLWPGSPICRRSKLAPD